MPRYRSHVRHLRSMVSALTFATVLAMLPGWFAPASGASRSSVPLSVHAVWRAIVNGSPVDVHLQLRGPASATIDADGRITIPRDSAAFVTDPLNPEPVPGTGISTVELVAERNITGGVDLATGALSLEGDVVMHLSGPGLTNCPIGPTTIAVSSAHADGNPYDVATGPDFVLPPITDGAFGCAGQESWMNIALALGVPGTSAMLLDVNFGSTAPPPSTSPPAAPSTNPPASAPPAVAPATPAPAPPAPATAGTPTTAKKSTKKASTPTTRSADAAAARASTTTTTMYSGPALADPNEVVPVPPLRDDGGAPTTADRAEIATRLPVSDNGDDRTSFGIGMLIASGVGALVAIALLRSEAQKFLRRKRNAAF